MLLQASAYALHLLSGVMLLAVFFAIYSKITPFDELALIRQGNAAAALSLGGAGIGFCLTIVSSIVHNDTLMMFLIWSVGAMLVQTGVYAILTRVLPQMNPAIESNNVAMGGLMGAMSLMVGMINAASLS
jgi:putative membrane protein